MQEQMMTYSTNNIDRLVLTAENGGDAELK